MGYIANKSVWIIKKTGTYLGTEYLATGKLVWNGGTAGTAADWDYVAPAPLAIPDGYVERGMLEGPLDEVIPKNQFLADYALLFRDSQNKGLGGIDNEGRFILPHIFSQFISSALSVIEKLNVGPENNIDINFPAIVDGLKLIGWIDEEGKVNIPQSVISGIQFEQNSGYIESPIIIKDSDGKAIAVINADGSVNIANPVLAETKFSTAIVPDLLLGITDKNGKVLLYIEEDGTVKIPTLQGGTSDFDSAEILQDIDRNYRLALSAAAIATTNHQDRTPESIQRLEDVALSTGQAPYILPANRALEPGLFITIIDDDSIDHYAQPLADLPYRGGYFSFFRGCFKTYDMPCCEAQIRFTTIATSRNVLLSKALQDYHGWEIVHHSRTHSHPVVDGVASPAYDIEEEWSGSVDTLRSYGLNIKNAVYPFGPNSHAIRQMCRRKLRANVGWVGRYGGIQAYPLETMTLSRYNLDATGGFGDSNRLPHQDRVLSTWQNSIQAALDRVANGERLWMMFMTHAYKSEWVNWDTTALGPYTDGVLPTDWGAGESGYNTDWVVLGLRDGSNNLIYPTVPLTAGDLDIPVGWRPQLNTRLHDLFTLLGWISSSSAKVITFDQGMDLFQNPVEIGDYTGNVRANAAPVSDLDIYPHFVVGIDGSTSFRARS